MRGIIRRRLGQIAGTDILPGIHAILRYLTNPNPCSAFAGELCPPLPSNRAPRTRRSAQLPLASQCSTYVQVREQCPDEVLRRAANGLRILLQL